VLDEKPFAVILADDLIKSDVSATTQLVQRFRETNGASIIGVQAVPAETVSRYGIVAYDKGVAASSLAVLAGMVEKPSPEKAPSNMAAIGRYVFAPSILDKLVQTRPGKGGEIQLTDAIVALAKDERVYAGVIEGARFDCGSKLGYLQASMVYGLNHPDIGGEFKHWLADLAESLKN
jgi:UTP--glucose-1-phosphate uridylyltransferase